MAIQTPEESVKALLDANKSRHLLSRSKWIIIAISTFLLYLLASSISNSKSNEKPHYATVELKRDEIMIYVTATGHLSPVNEITVGSEVSGLIKDVLVDINDTVKKGDALAQIDTEKLQDTILRSEASLDQAKASVLQAEASLELANADLNRIQALHRVSGGQTPSLAEIDQARAESKRAEANLAGAKASVLAAKAQLATDRTNLARATIRSPVDGVILSRNVDPGQTLAASFTTPLLFIIAENLDAMQLEILVDEADIGQVKAGQHANFTVDAYPGRNFDAIITRVNLGANSTGGAISPNSVSSVISYGAILSVENADLNLRPGMTATANILTRQEKNVLLAPNTALRYKPTKAEDTKENLAIDFRPKQSGEKQVIGIGPGAHKSIYILNNEGNIEERQVLTGYSDGSWTIVTGSNIEQGMLAITGELASKL